MRPPKYVTLPSEQNMVMDPTNTVVVGLEISLVLTAHGHIVRKDKLYTFPEEDRFSYSSAMDMAVFARQVTKAQEATNIVEEAEAEMDALIAAEG